MIPMIEAAFRTGPMAAASGADRSAAGRRATRRRAIRVAAIARGADREEAAAEPTRFLAKRRVHDVGAATHSNWTRTSNRGTKRDDWLGPSEHRGGHRGSGGRSSRPSPRLPRTQLTRPHADAQAEEAVDADGAMDAQTRPQLLAKPRRRGFARAPTAIIFFVIRRPERKDRREQSRSDPDDRILPTRSSLANAETRRPTSTRVSIRRCSDHTGLIPVGRTAAIMREARAALDRIESPLLRLPA